MTNTKLFCNECVYLQYFASKPIGWLEEHNNLGRVRGYQDWMYPHCNCPHAQQSVPNPLSPIGVDNPIIINKNNDCNHHSTEVETGEFTRSFWGKKPIKKIVLTKDLTNNN